MFADRWKKFNFQLRKLAPEICNLGGYVLLQMVTGSHKQRQNSKVLCAVIGELLGHLLQGWRCVLHETERDLIFASIPFQVASQLLKRLEPVWVLAAVS